MLWTVIRSLLAFAVGITVAFILVVGVELASSVLHPLPSDFNETMEEMCKHVANYPTWVLALVVPSWGLTATLSTWIAGRLGNIYSSGSLSLLLIAAVALNVSMLPYAIWFKIVILLAVPISSLVGMRLNSRNIKSSLDLATDEHGSSRIT